MRNWRICLGPLLFLQGFGQHGTAQDTDGTRVPVFGPLKVVTQPVVARGVAAMPKVLAGPVLSADLAAKINSASRRLDKRVGVAAMDCRLSTRKLQHKGGSEAWVRGVEVTMRGPRYFSVVASDSYQCGFSYPNDGVLLPLVYDLATGSPVNWLKLLPDGATGIVDDAADGTRVGAVIWPVLTAMAKANATAGCRDAYGGEGQVSFVLWLDAKRGMIQAQPVNLPHVISACAQAVELSPATARELGMKSELIEALQQAHFLQR